MVHTYRNVATGFAAKLTAEEQGLGAWKGANYGAGVIIGVLDTGIGPDHPSFSDEGVPPPPAKWKGNCAAGNSGPDYESLSNEAPWILTVGASTIDRSKRATALLGNHGEFDGVSLNQPKDFNSTLLPLVYPGVNGDQSLSLCAPGSLGNVEGKIVLCEGGRGRVAKREEVKRAGGAAMILANLEAGGYTVLADAHVLPATHVSYAAWLMIKAYINSTATPQATISFKGTVIGDPLAPQVTFFSSRGPSIASPGILKLDIIGPGVSILAAWPVSVDNATLPNPKATFNMVSGTSMSYPHLSGIAALLKSSHPDWSPAAIKSAIMTTAKVNNLGGQPIVDETLKPAAIFATGAGHVNPSNAIDPGLIYDINPADYIPYMCGLNYINEQIQVFTQQTVNCSEVGTIPEAQLNYPSFSIIIGSSDESKSQDYTRTVKNVGPASSTYKLDLNVPHKMGMSVNPEVLTFTEVNQEITFSVEFIAQEGTGKDGVLFDRGYLKWISDKHSVTSPISVIFDT
ncbi:hypothetical protein ACFX2I_037903 [Malus domestica]